MLSSNVAEAGGFLKSRPTLDRPDLQLHFCAALVDDHNRHMHWGHGYSLHVCVLRPHSRGTVTLASADARTAPVIDPRFLSDARDLDLLVEGAQIARRILDAPSLALRGGKELYTHPGQTRSGVAPRRSPRMPIRSITRSRRAGWAAMRRPWSIRSCGCAA